ncbi:hypothetical protein ABPG74_010770 [Tetrahymena malaccensis]
MYVLLFIFCFSLYFCEKMIEYLTKLIENKQVNRTRKIKQQEKSKLIKKRYLKEQKMISYKYHPNQFQQGATTTISYRIEDIKQSCKDYQISGNVNLSQVKKIISQQMQIPMKELKLQKLIKNLQSNEIDDSEMAQQQIKYSDDIKIENKSTLIFGIDSLQQEQLNFQFNQQFHAKSFFFNVYKDDTLYNLRAKIFIETKLTLKDGDKLEFQSPDEIQMEIQIDKNNKYVVTDYDLNFTVQQFIEGKFKNVNFGQEFILQYQKLKENQLQLMISDQIFDVKMHTLLFQLHEENEKQIEIIIRGTQNLIEKEEHSKFEKFYNSQSSRAVNKDDLFYNLYKENLLIISVGSDQVDIQSYLEKNKKLKDGDHLNFTLMGC